MEKQLQNMTKAEQDWDLIEKTKKEHPIGIILPFIAWVTAFIMSFTTVLCGPPEPYETLGKKITDKNKEAHYRDRAYKVDIFVILRVAFAVIILSVFNIWQNYLGFRWVVGCLCSFFIINIIVSVSLFGIIKGKNNTDENKDYHPYQVYSVPRVIVLSLINYIEIIFYFALLYLVADCLKFNPDNRQIIGPLDTLYFSGTTIFTIGYGDILPKSMLGKFLSLFEVAVGVLILTILVGRMLGSSRKIGEYTRSSLNCNNATKTD